MKSLPMRSSMATHGRLDDAPAIARTVATGPAG